MIEKLRNTSMLMQNPPQLPPGHSAVSIPPTLSDAIDKINELIIFTYKLSHQVDALQAAVNKLEEVGDGLCHCSQARRPHIWQSRFCPKDNAPKLV